jgi:hypothetical protein
MDKSGNRGMQMSVTKLDTDSQHVPLRPDFERWATRAVSKHVLAVVHTVTAGQRLLEALRLLEGDPRVQVYFTAAHDIFHDGVAEFLADLKGLTITWAEAVRTEFDLALAAAHSDLHELHAPVVVLPHGAGHNKFTSARRRGRTAPGRNVYGMSHQWLIRDGSVVPEAIVFSHREELERLGRECPEALPAAKVVGDPCADRLRASVPSRALYRSAMGVEHGRQLVLVCSTWGPESLLAREWELLEKLVSRLPREKFHVALLLHPNGWHGHGQWTVRSWLAGLCRNGLILLSHRADWCGAMVAADYIVGDDGSLMLYGAMTGVPVLLAGQQRNGAQLTGVDPDSPMAELRSIAPRLRGDRSPERQLRRSQATYQREQYERVAARITSQPGRYAHEMRTLIYRMLRLRAPAVRLGSAPARLPTVVHCDDYAGPAW